MNKKEPSLCEFCGDPGLEEGPYQGTRCTYTVYYCPRCDERWLIREKGVEKTLSTTRCDYCDNLVFQYEEIYAETPVTATIYHCDHCDHTWLSHENEMILDAKLKAYRQGVIHEETAIPSTTSDASCVHHS